MSDRFIDVLCSKCNKSKLILMAISFETNLKGLSRKYLAQVKANEVLYCKCGHCGQHYLIFRDGTVYYFLGGWCLLQEGNTKEIVVFT